MTRSQCGPTRRLPETHRHLRRERGRVAGSRLFLLVRDRNHVPSLAKLVLLQPMLDDRSSTRHLKPDRPLHESLEGMIADLDMCWETYLAGNLGGADVSPYSPPARATELARLPPTYVEVGAMDWFRDESMEVAARLVEACLKVELHVSAAMSHCYDMIAPDVPVTMIAKQNRLRAVRSTQIGI